MFPFTNVDRKIMSLFSENVMMSLQLGYLSLMGSVDNSKKIFKFLRLTDVINN